MLSDEWLSRYGLLENFNASVTRTGTGTGTGTGTWTTGVTAIALCTSCSRAKKILSVALTTKLNQPFCLNSYLTLEGYTTNTFANLSVKSLKSNLCSNNLTFPILR